MRVSVNSLIQEEVQTSINRTKQDAYCYVLDLAQGASLYRGITPIFNSWPLSYTNSSHSMEKLIIIKPPEQINYTKGLRHLKCAAI